MASEFDDIKFEVETTDGWIDITSDVLIDPAPKWNSGIMGNRLTDRVGSPGYLTFSLDNSEYNSASTRSYYSPSSSDCLGGWKTGRPVRLSFTFESQPFYKFYGHIAPTGIKVHPGVKESRHVDVMVEDFIAMTDRHPLQLMEIETGIAMDGAVNSIVAALPIKPLEMEFVEANGVVYATMFDNIKENTTASAEFNKLAMSEFGFISRKGNGINGETLLLEGNYSRTTSTTDITDISLCSSDSGFLLMETTGDYLLYETSDKIILNQVEQAAITDNELYPGTEFSYGAHIINMSTSKAYPRRVDAAATTVLWALQEDFEIAGGATTSKYIGRYRDPSGGFSRVNGTDMVAPTTDDFLAETSGGVNATTDITLTTNYYSDHVEYTLVNNSLSTRVIKTLRARGKGIYFYDTLDIVDNDSSSQALYGIIPASFEFKYQGEPNTPAVINSAVVINNKTPSTWAEKLVIFANRNGRTMYSFLKLEPGTKILVSETMNAVSSEVYYVNGYEAEIVNGKHVWFKIVAQKAQNYVFI